MSGLPSVASGNSPLNPDRFTAFAVPRNGHAEGLRPVQGYPAGVTLFQQGCDALDVFYLEEGLMKLLRIQPDGREVIVGLRVGVVPWGGGGSRRTPVCRDGGNGHPQSGWASRSGGVSAPAQDQWHA